MFKSGKVLDSDNLALIGVTIAESDSAGKYITPLKEVITTDINGNFKGNFKNNTFYTVSFVGSKKFIFNTKNGIPKTIKLENDLTLPEITIKGKQTYYYLIPVSLILFILFNKK